MSPDKVPERSRIAEAPSSIINPSTERGSESFTWRGALTAFLVGGGVAFLATIGAKDIVVDMLQPSAEVLTKIEGGTWGVLAPGVGLIKGIWDVNAYSVRCHD